MKWISPGACFLVMASLGVNWPQANSTGIKTHPIPIDCNMKILIKFTEWYNIYSGHEQQILVQNVCPSFLNPRSLLRWTRLKTVWSHWHCQESRSQKPRALSTNNYCECGYFSEWLISRFAYVKLSLCS